MHRNDQKTNLLLSFSSLAALLILAACGATPATEPAGTLATEPVVVSQPTGTAAVVASVEPEPTSGQVAAEGVSFSQDVQPILAASCTRCHGSSRQSGGLRLDSLAGLMAGGRDGQVVIPGNAADSLLVQLISEGTMPKNAADLPQASIQTIVDWVNSGALDN